MIRLCILHYFQVCCSLLAHSCCFVSVSCCANKGHKPDTVVLVKKTRYHCFDWFNAWVKSISYGEKFNYPLLYVVGKDKDTAVVQSRLTISRKINLKYHGVIVCFLFLPKFSVMEFNLDGKKFTIPNGIVREGRGFHTFMRGCRFSFQTCFCQMTKTNAILRPRAW